MRRCPAAAARVPISVTGAVELSRVLARREDTDPQSPRLR